ncbi:alpha/beta fold hydrolase [Thauera linaloolentis]|uniref:Hydrolase n=1 Tax=Thauera linaloolentis (strain DSM 12138 / JCM 21573 / CCUG 41526 / CIP 105981 / IAM 15112 / NBRC 102519 / 47Lol) TaxID=1123367 RepID=N6Y1R2_THAL4|nr:alpha/beta hydrolase [Thauera linaloolentis]ENO88131.1 hydrolase [Thauera linaloolentis 47Lol = DSM 12138]MCM8565823.1 alpha/beta hydrolase [Thauera linaloolentis]
MSLFSDLSRAFEPPAPPRRPVHGVRERHVQCIGPHGLHRMAYTEWGEADNPRVVICVHGLTRNGRDFDDLAQALAGDYRVVCPDVVGRGRSDWLGVKEDYGFPLYVSDMVTLIARLNVEQVDWVGTSMGGIIGMLIASQPHAPIRRLVLNDVGPLITAVSLQRIGPYVGRAPRFATMDEAEAYIRQVSAPFGPLTDAQWRHLTHYSVRPVGGPDGGFAMVYDPALGDVFRATPATEDIDMWPVYERIGCPTLALRGAESDLLEHSTLEAMAARGPRAQTVEFAGVGHAPMLMDPGQIAVVQNFLRAV